VLGSDHHVVPKVIKAKLIVGAVDDRRGVGLASLLRCKAVDNQAHIKAEETVDLAHPLTITAGQVVIDGDDVGLSAHNILQVCGKRGSKGLALTGLHLSDIAIKEDHTANELHVKVTHACNPD